MNSRDKKRTRDWWIPFLLGLFTGWTLVIFLIILVSDIIDYSRKNKKNVLKDTWTWAYLQGCLTFLLIVFGLIALNFLFLGNILGLLKFKEKYLGWKMNRNLT